MKVTFFTFTFVCLSMMYALIFPESGMALSYDFENPKQLDDWKVIRSDKPVGIWAIENGELSYEYPKAGGGFNINMIKHLKFSDGVIQFKLKWISGSWLSIGCFYRIVDKENWYYTEIGDWDKTSRWLGQERGDFIGIAKRAFTPEEGIWYEYKIVVKKERHEVWIDGKLIHAETDKRFKAGGVGFGGQFGGASEHVHFDDLKIVGEGIRGKAVGPTSKLATSWGKNKSGY